ncbi:somatostatin receptor type 2-like [Paramacrobiotus metropolitanus]|uniref:somatostatin receptor type 2-like n=1 Tax=Paramacrobiotus metropolitanus TaxID=2943436 RepID=UPI002446012E|nr:somatostatin receptor type 2-like [Paramacrobiotus metropolitanus]
MSSNVSNTSTVELYGPVIAVGVFAVVKLALNGCLLFFFLKSRSLRTPFTVYLINLLLSNILVTLADPFFMMESWQVRWFFTSILFNMKIYFDHVGSALDLHAHLLITLNRMWALTFPLNYRNYHSTQIAVVICLTMGTYCHVLLSPLLLQDLLYYRPNMQTATECEVVSSAQPVLRRFLKIWINNVPVLIILAAYPYLLCRTMDVGKTFHCQAAIIGKSSLQRPAKENRHAFLILTATTFITLICWTPTKIIGILKVFGDTAIPDVLQIVFGDVIYSLQQVLDPILLTLSFKSLRKAFKSKVGLICRRG